MDHAANADIDVPIPGLAASVGQPRTGGERGGGDDVCEFGAGGLGPCSAPVTGRHVPDLLAQPPMSMRQYINNGGVGDAPVRMLEARQFEALPVN